MFMFWSKRAVLTRRLLKAKVRGEHETECETQEDTLSRINVSSTNNIAKHQQQQNSKDREVQTTRAQKTTSLSPSSSSSSSSTSSTSSTSSSSSTSGNRAYSVATRFHQGCCGGDFSHDEDEELRHDNNTNRQNRNPSSNRLTRCKELLKSLKENQLEMLLNAVESYGADFGSCVLVPRKQQQQQQQQQQITQQQQRSSNPRRFNALESNTSGSPAKLKQQESSMPQCNRHQRCGLSSSNLHDNSSRRLPHRHILRSRRHNPGARCSRCVNCHQNSGEDVAQNQQQRGRDDLPSTIKRDDDKPPADLDDHRQEQPAWCSPEEPSSNNETVGEPGQTSNDTADASRPERDRCRRSQVKITRSTTTGARKRRESSPSNLASDNAGLSPDNCYDSPPDDPHLLSCQTWRWPDLANSSELKKLPVCHSAKDPVYICCNPYHWSRLCKPESPPPPYCLIPDRLRPEDRAPSEISGDYRRCGIATSPRPPRSGSLTTNGEGDSEMGQKEWCTLAYWELGGRVGRLYPVEPSTVNVFDSLHDGDGLCLATLAENHVASPAVQRTRSKIGLGLMLSQESDGVWAYNRSESPIFVNSPTLDDPESRTLLVYRVPPGFCLNIFDRAKTMKLPSRCIGQSSPMSGSFNSGPVDVNSVRISFAKGWGPKYSRQEVTSCPCWLEVLLAPCR